MSLFGKRTAEPLDGHQAQKPSPFGTSQASTSATSLFGQNPTTPNPFGSQATSNPGSNPAPLFGQNPSTAQNKPSLFGTQPQQTSASTSTNLFGTPSATTNATSSGGGLFSTQPAQQQPTPNLFGNPQSTPSTTSNTGLFGTPASGGGSLFGAKPANNLFGTSTTSVTGTPNQQNNHQLGTLFSGTPQQAGSTVYFGNSQNSNSLFGNTLNNKPSMFGQPANAPTAPFGSQPPATPTGLFSSSNSAMNRSAPPSVGGAWNGLKSTTSLASQLYRRPIAASSEMTIQDRILKIYSSWNVTDPQCQFQYFFYNVVPPEQVHLYGRPPQLAPDDPKWQRAKRNNPDPSRLVPTLAIGFEDLAKRVNVQKNQGNAHLSKLQEISTRLEELVRKHNLQTISRLHKLKSEQSKLTGRLIHLIANMSNLVGPSVIQNMRLEPIKEEDLMIRIKALKSALEDSGKSKVSELWSSVSQLKLYGGPLGSEGVGKWSMTNDKEIKKVLEVLMNQQKGIDHLTLLLRKSRADVMIMRQAFDLESSIKTVDW